jgi:hypothetical protein
MEEGEEDAVVVPDAGGGPTPDPTPDASLVVDLLDPEESAFRPIEEVLRDDPDALKMSKEEFDALPVKAKASMSRLRSLMTVKTGELAAASRDIATQRATLAAQLAAGEAERSQLLKLYGDPKHLGEAPADEGPDPRIDPEGYIKWIAARETFGRMQAFGKALGKAGTDKQAELDAASTRAVAEADSAKTREWFEGLAGRGVPEDIAIQIEDTFLERLSSTHTPDKEELLVLALHKAQVAKGVREEEARARTAGITLRPSGNRGAPPHTPDPPIPIDSPAEELAAYFSKYPNTRMRWMAMSADERADTIRVQRKRVA